jgi:hypothetical protein
MAFRGWLIVLAIACVVFLIYPESAARLLVQARLWTSGLSLSGDDKADCQNSKLPTMLVLEACNRAIKQSGRQMREINQLPIGKTKILDTFDGCDYGKKYDLMNGYTLECRTYHYHYKYAPESL